MFFAFYVFKKDFHSELRNRYSINSLLMFVMITISIVLFGIVSETSNPLVLSGVLWIVIFFSSMTGLSRAFVSEEEKGTTLFLQLNSKPLHVFLGKFLFNILLMLFINCVTILLYFFFVSEFQVKNFSIFFLTLFLGTFSISLFSTFIAAIVAKANTKGALFPILSFPILIPIFISVISATKIAVEGKSFSFASPDFQILISYILVIFSASILFFDFIWKE